MTNAAPTGNLDVQTVPLAALRPHPSNPRNGDVEAIAESIEANGLYAPLVVQASTGYVLKGNHTYAALLSLGRTEAPAVMLDVDDDRATRILLVDNRTSDLSRYDDAILADLLASLADTSGLDGTGYDVDALDDLLGALERYQAEPLGPPPTLGDAETPEEAEERAASRGNEGVTASGLREMVLVFTLDDHATLLRLLKEYRTVSGIGEESNSKTVMHAVLTAIDAATPPMPKRRK